MTVESICELNVGELTTEDAVLFLWATNPKLTEALQVISSWGFNNKYTGQVYEDIALEYWSDEYRHIPGWVCKPLMCDYIAYAIAPLGKGYLLPVIQLQRAWVIHSEEWLEIYPPIKAKNYDPRSGRRWTTVSVGVPVQTVFTAIGSGLRCNFDPIEL